MARLSHRMWQPDRDSLEVKGILASALLWGWLLLGAGGIASWLVAWADRGTPEGRDAIPWGIGLTLLAAGGCWLWIRLRASVPLTPERIVEEDGLPALLRSIPEEDFAAVADSLADAGPEAAASLASFAASRTFAPAAESLGGFCQRCGREAPLLRSGFHRTYGDTEFRVSERFAGNLCRDCIRAYAREFAEPPEGLRGLPRALFRLQNLLYAPSRAREVRRSRLLAPPPREPALDEETLAALRPLLPRALSALRKGGGFPAVVAGLARGAGVARNRAAFLLLGVLQVVEDNAWKKAPAMRRRRR